jgi:hypothetical protein
MAVVELRHATDIVRGALEDALQVRQLQCGDRRDKLAEAPGVVDAVAAEQPDSGAVLIGDMQRVFPISLRRIEHGALQYKHGTGRWVGKATLLEERSREYLRFVHDTGVLGVEYERAQ